VEIKSLKDLEKWLVEDYDHYMTKLEDMPSSNTAFDYLHGYTDHMEECIGIVRYLMNKGADQLDE
jgi:hypothetical protein